MINCAIVGVGNCASSLVQGVYKAKSSDGLAGLMYEDIGGYKVKDINFTAAFDVNVTKVGLDLSRAIFAEPNNTIEFHEPAASGVKVMRGMTHDGIGKYASPVIKKAPPPTVAVAQVLKDTKTDVVVNYLPVGSEEAVKWYAEQALSAGCAFINCMPVFIASDKTGYWPQRFEQAGLPVIGDDIKSQLGATILHRTLARLFESRGIRIDRTYQLNFGGNLDFLNMLERERLVSKKISKTNSVQSQLGVPLPSKNIHIGPSDYIEWLEDRKWAHVRIEGRGFADVPLTVELKLEVWDSPNSAGVVVDAIRCAKIALDRKLKGPIIPPSAWLMKSPPQQFTDEAAHNELEAWLAL